MEAEQKKETYWNDLLGNKYRVNLHPAMLVGDGYRSYMSTRTTGDSKSDKSKQGLVLFDREYVLNFIVKRILEPLKVTDYEDMSELLLDALALHLGTTGIKAPQRKVKVSNYSFDPQNMDIDEIPF